MKPNAIPQRPEYYVQTGSMFENPYGVPHDQIVQFILNNEPEVVAQVVFGKYVESSGLVFSGQLIQQMIDRNLPRVIGNSYLDRNTYDRRHEVPDPFRFFTGVDFARQTDYTVITTIDTMLTPARVVYWKRLNRVPWETIYTEVGRAVLMWGKNVLCDGTGPGGDVVMDALDSRFICPEHRHTFLVNSVCPKRKSGDEEACNEETWVPLSCCDPFYFTGTTKKELVEHLRNVLSVGYDPTAPDVEFGHLRTPPIVQLEEELAFYTWEDRKLDTDCLFSLALAAWEGLEDPVADPFIGSVYGG